MTEQERQVIEGEINILRECLIPYVGPNGVYSCIKKYIELRKELAPRERISEHTEIIEMNPIFDTLEDAINQLADDWQCNFWLSELERYKKETYVPPSTPTPTIVLVSGI